jgi:hypothetical protein
VLRHAAGVQAALAVAPGAAAPSVVKAIENAVGPPDALEDDATLLVLAPLDPSEVSA